MKTSKFMSRHFAVGYETSENRKIYDFIAFSYGISPRIVYMIAHGRTPANKKEAGAKNDLFNAGILRATGYVEYKRKGVLPRPFKGKYKLGTIKSL